MEVAEFLKLRTRFLRQHYETASEPFREIIRKIEAEEDPYEPPYSEDGDEPAFMEEWTDARTSLEMVGASCVSMLSDALKLYFMTWEQQLGINCQKHVPKEFKKGFVNGYKVCFGELLKTDWKDCPADWDVIEQIVMARNDASHAKDISELRINHSDKVRERFAKPFFLSEDERRIIETEHADDYFWFGLNLVVEQETLFEAIRQVEALAAWMEEPLFEVKYGRR